MNRGFTVRGSAEGGTGHGVLYSIKELLARYFALSTCWTERGVKVEREKRRKQEGREIKTEGKKKREKGRRKNFLVTKIGPSYQVYISNIL